MSDENKDTEELSDDNLTGIDAVKASHKAMGLEHPEEYYQDRYPQYYAEEDDDSEEDNDDSEEDEEDDSEEDEEDDSEEDEEDDSEEDEDEDSEEDEEDDSEEDEEDDSEEDEEDDSEEDEDEDNILEQKNPHEKGSKEALLFDIKKIKAKNKKIQDELEEKDEENVRLQETLDKKEKELEGLQAAGIDVANHPTFVKEKDRVVKRLASKINSLPFANTGDLIPKWANYVGDLREIEDKPVNEQKNAFAEVTLRVAKQLGLVDDNTEALDYDIDSDVIREANTVVREMQTFTPDYDKLKDIAQELETKSRSKVIELGYNDYKQKTQPFREILMTLDEFTQQDIKSDPYSIESLAAKKIKAKEGAKLSAEIDDKLLSLVFGTEPLSQEAIDRMVAAKKDMTKFHTTSEKRLDNMRKDLLPKFKKFLLLENEIEETLRQKAKDQKQTSKRTKEKNTVKKVLKNKRGVAKKTTQTKEVTLEDRQKNIRDALNGQV